MLHGNAPSQRPKFALNCMLGCLKAPIDEKSFQVILQKLCVLFSNALNTFVVLNYDLIFSRLHLSDRPSRNQQSAALSFLWSWVQYNGITLFVHDEVNKKVPLYFVVKRKRLISNTKRNRRSLPSFILFRYNQNRYPEISDFGGLQHVNFQTRCKILISLLCWNIAISFKRCSPVIMTYYRAIFFMLWCVTGAGVPDNNNTRVVASVCQVFNQITTRFIIARKAT